MDIDTLTPWIPTLNSTIPFSEWWNEASVTLSSLSSLLDRRTVYVVADIVALNAITWMDIGDIAIVSDTFDITWENVAWSFVYNWSNRLLQSWYSVYLDTLLDVTITTPSSWQVLSYDWTKRINTSLPTQPVKTRHIEELFTWDTIELLHTPVFIYSVCVNWVIYYEWIDRDLVWSDIVFSTIIWANDTVEVIYEY